MTTVPVTDIGRVMPVGSETGQTPPVNGQDFMGKFRSAIETQSSAMDIAPAQSQDANRPVAAQDNREVNRASKAAPDRDAVKTDVRDKAAQTGKEKKAATDTEETQETVTPEVAEAINEAAGQVAQQVADELGIDLEEVLKALEDLGLTMTDLLDPANMVSLVTELSGEQDAVSLLTDENLYQTLGNLQDYVAEVRDDLTRELDLSQEAFDEALVQTEELNEHSLPDETDPVPAETLITSDKSAAETQDFKMVSSTGDGQVTMDVKVDDATGVQIVTGISRDNPTESDSQGTSENGNERNDKDDPSSHVSAHTDQTVQLNTNNTQSFTNVTDEVTGFRTEPSEIANQIMESMRANIRPDVTELEMNLHPASLGNVRVNLQAQNGQVTAQFLAQNETVRAAIESQIVQLRETLEAQGIRIEQVEVAVASQGFDRNRDNGRDHGNGEGGSGQDGRVAKTGRIRRIDLDALEDEDALEELEDADRIAAEMMAHDGNRVDYLA